MKGFLLVLLLSQILFAEFKWKGYRIEAGESYTYRYIEYLSGKRREGEFTIRILENGDRIEVELKGSYGSKSGILKKAVRSFSELAGFIAVRMYTEHWMIPLGKTVLMRGLVGVFEGKEVVFREREKVQIKDCSAGGFKGKMMVIEDREIGKLWICTAKGLSLPLILRRRTLWDDLYEATLIRFRKIK